ncbi:DotD/TraH family lipoprotein [Pseudomonas sp. MB-090624]|uniref:DotD/TraH family lipoprotein n=1 Tax=Pseudomonas sp. MB-090624 TaxID=2213078 RepID=UPI002113930D|nr:DotD/TraH family lipoprotein [Pseudomonas sp. MB-090624]
MKGILIGARAFKVGGVLLAMVALGGCASSAKPTTEDTEAFASRIIADKVSVAVNSQHAYVSRLNADRARVASRQAAVDTDQVDIDFIGKPQELLQTFASRYGYAYVESGKRVDLKPINVWVRKATPINVVKDVGAQIDTGADVVLDKSTNTLRLIYKPVPLALGRG